MACSFFALVVVSQTSVFVACPCIFAQSPGGSQQQCTSETSTILSLRVCGRYQRAMDEAMQDLQPNAEAPTERKRRRLISWSTVLWTILLSIPWILVAVPSLNTTGNSQIGIVSSDRWQGSDSVSLYGWPFVHATRLTVDDKIVDIFGLPAKENPTGPSKERLEACLQNLTSWTGVYSVDEVTERPQLMLAHAVESPRNRLALKSGFQWSSLNRWNYGTDDRSLIKWHPGAVLINGALFLCYILVVILVLETLARRRKHWWQFSLTDFLVAVSAIGIVVAVVASEARTGKRQLELAAQLKNEFKIDVSVTYRPPTFLSRLLGESRDWWIYSLGAEGAFNRIERLNIKCRAAGDRGSDFEHVKKILSQPDFDTVTHLTIEMSDPSQFDLIDIVSPNVKSLVLHYKSQPPVSLNNLKRFPHLVYLELENSAVAFSKLPALPNLVCLRTSIATDDLTEEKTEKLTAWLASMSSLRSIWLDVDGQPEPVLTAIPKTVESMYVAPQGTREIDLSGLSKLRRLKRISMYTSSTQTITRAPKLPELKYFFLQGFAVSDDAPKLWRDHASPY